MVCLGTNMQPTNENHGKQNQERVWEDRGNGVQDFCQSDRRQAQKNSNLTQKNRELFKF